MDILIDTIRDSLLAITHPRFYETERGFQGQLNAELNFRLQDLEIDGAIVEQEYQKRIKDHGFKIRPDLIVHIPFEGAGFDSRSVGNFVVIELKHRANRKSARADYQNLHRMCDVLGYPLAVFINIDSDKTFIDECMPLNNGSIHAFAVKLTDGQVEITEQTTK
ncbi:hypothetical protein [Rheinheimera soli]|uniref:hypothetical protein n=1 Tax=Rheinheimera soli TaxID=443616 RepID=UPI001E34F242|nr:hypothetical protein [Rheinheimera soli]